MAHFAFVANVTTLAMECDIAISPAMSVASCRNLPQPVLAFSGESPDLLANYATFLADPGTEVDLWVTEAQLPAARQAFEVLETLPQVQWIFRGATPPVADQAAPLTAEDVATALALVKAEKVELRVPGKDILAAGPAFGVWDKRRLMALATTSVRIPGAAEIGNLVVRREARRLSYAADVIAALTAALLHEELRPFIVLPESESDLPPILESLGFVRERRMYFLHCVIKAAPSEEAHA